MEKGWVSVFSTNQEYIAELAKELLEENDIQLVLLNQKDSAHPNLFAGDIEILVKRENVIRAKYLLKELDN
jgi:hypothetical protein